MEKLGEPSGLRDVALLTDKRFRKLMSSVRVGDRAARLSPTQAANAFWAFLVCRKLCGVKLPVIAGGPPPAESSTSTNRIKLSSVLNQQSEESIAPPTDDRTKFDNEFFNITGDFPSPEEECSIEQLTALEHML